jgi:hypothetical protein
MTDSAPSLASLGARVHLFVHPGARAEFTRVFRDVLQCEVRELDFGMPHPVLLVPFPDGSAFSVEFSELAPPPRTSPVNDATASRGAWIEFRTTRLEHYQSRLVDAGVASFTHPGSSHTYFSAPGGQVFRLLDIGYAGP